MPEKEIHGDFVVRPDYDAMYVFPVQLVGFTADLYIFSAGQHGARVCCLPGWGLTAGFLQLRAAA